MHPDAGRIQLFPDTSADVAALKPDRIDAFFLGVASANGLLRDQRITGLKRAQPFKGHIEANGREKINYGGIAVRRDDSDFRDLFNQELTKIKTGNLYVSFSPVAISDSGIPPKDLTAKELCGSSIR
ncbi:transporter substrate-binding domain-containing protein [Chelatococcus asaccharovorans]|nr:transporter substrate-binding domain-containing protein [Chelatococcus asaccharovorans]